MSNIKASSIMSTRHTSLDRPLATPLEGGLPRGAVPYGARSSWPLIVVALYHNRGVWHRLERHYQHPSSPLASARKWSDAYLPAGASEMLDVAFTPLASGKVEVYLRIRTEDQAPMYSPEDDDDDSEELGAVPLLPESEPEEPSTEFQERLDEIAESNAVKAATIESEGPAQGRNSRALTASQVRQVRMLRAAGSSLKEVAERFEVAESVISNIANRKTYAWVED